MSSSDPCVGKHSADLRDSQAISDEYTKILGIEWNASGVNVTNSHHMTKRSFVSDVPRTCDTFGWPP